MSDSSAFACALSPEQLKFRRSELRSRVSSQVKGVASLEGGIQIDFASGDEIKHQIDEFIAFEQGCCHFLTFTVTASEQGLSLQIHGPPEAAETIDMFRRTAQGKE